MWVVNGQRRRCGVAGHSDGRVDRGGVGVGDLTEDRQLFWGVALLAALMVMGVFVIAPMVGWL